MVEIVFYFSCSTLSELQQALECCDFNAFPSNINALFHLPLQYLSEKFGLSSGSVGMSLFFFSSGEGSQYHDLCLPHLFSGGSMRDSYNWGGSDELWLNTKQLKVNYNVPIDFVLLLTWLDHRLLKEQQAYQGIVGKLKTRCFIWLGLTIWILGWYVLKISPNNK